MLESPSDQLLNLTPMVLSLASRFNDGKLVRGKSRGLHNLRKGARDLSPDTDHGFTVTLSRTQNRSVLAMPRKAMILSARTS